MNQLTSLDPQAFDQINTSSQPRRLESFFDHDLGDPKLEKSLWMMPNKNQTSETKFKMIMEAAMEKQGRKTHAWKTRHYILAEDFLAYKEVIFYNDRMIYWILEAKLKDYQKGYALR